MRIINEILAMICEFIAIFLTFVIILCTIIDNEIRYQFLEAQSPTNIQTTEQPTTKYDNESQYHIKNHIHEETTGKFY